MDVLRKKPTNKKIPLFNTNALRIEWKTVLSVFIWTTEIKDISILALLISV